MTTSKNVEDIPFPSMPADLTNLSKVLCPSKRGAEWERFSDKVLTHINTYTVPQYGDKGDDQIDDWSIKVCQLAIEKYIKRFGKNSRSGQDKLDVLKIAHYACFIYNKIEEEEDESN